MTGKIADFNDTELWGIKETLKERYGDDISLELGDSEIRMSPADRELTEVPVVYWAGRGSNFVIFKVGDGRYRAQFYYRGYQQYGTGKPEYDDITTCTVELLQVQADHEAKEREREEAGKK